MAASGDWGALADDMNIAEIVPDSNSDTEIGPYRYLVKVTVPFG